MTELIVVLINLVICLIPLGLVLAVGVYFFQRLRAIEGKLDRLLEHQTASPKDRT